MCLFAFRQTVKWRYEFIIMINFVSFYFSIHFLFIGKIAKSIELRFCDKLQEKYKKMSEVPYSQGYLLQNI